MPLTARLLTAGLLLLTAGLAGCASTSSGPSGAQQDAAVQAASPESSSGSPSADSTPDASPAASSTESASASADPSSDSAPDTEGEMLGSSSSWKVSNTDVCDTRLAFACGDTGPGGGVVYFASSTGFGCGAGMASSCNFLEVAPNGWNGQKVDCAGGCNNERTSDRGSEGIGAGKGYAYCRGMGEKHPIPDASNSAIGAGYANTRSMVANCKSGDAGQLAQSYTGGGLNDWYLPSMNELGALSYYYSSNKGAISGIAGLYWSSTQTSRAYTNNPEAYAVQWDDLMLYSVDKSKKGSVRPVRAF